MCHNSYYMVNITTGTVINDTEQLGAQAICQTNAFFQSSIIQGKSLKEEKRLLAKEKAKLEKEVKEWEMRAYAAEDEATSYKGKYELSEGKLKASHGVVIESYLKSDSFLDFMDQHDDRMHPESLTIGYNKAVKAVSRWHPEVVDPRAFSSMNWAGGGNAGAIQASAPGTRAISQTSESGSKGGRWDHPVRQPLPGKGLRNQLSSSSSSSSSSEEGGEDDGEG